MDRAEYIATEFDKYIDSAFVNENVKAYLKNHPRKALCQQRLREQFYTIEGTRLQSVTNEAKFKESVKQLTHDSARLFCKMALKKAEEDALTQAEKARRITDATELDDMQQMIEEETKAMEDDKLKSYPGMTTEQAK